MMRLKNCDLAMPTATGLERRHILRNGSRRFSKELALALTKHFNNASSDWGLTSSSSIRAVSSCSLETVRSRDYITSVSAYQDKTASNALTWK